MGRPRKFPKSLIVNSLFDSEYDNKISPFFQYVPLPLFFADDKLSFYKVMSDTQGYKHIHYVKEVSIFQLYSCKKYTTR